MAMKQEGESWVSEKDSGISSLGYMGPKVAQKADNWCSESGERSVGALQQAASR